MGTNFYYRIRKSRRSGWTVQEKHVGKRSAGWQFCFRAHKDEDGKIGSWKDWKELLISAGAGRIFDEYGKRWSAAEFIAMVEASKLGKNHSEYAAFVDRSWWNDPDGWSFSFEDFC
jgi:hypothetical protein